MLNIQITPDKPLMAQAGGSLADVVAELAIAVGDIYGGL